MHAHTYNTSTKSSLKRQVRLLKCTDPFNEFFSYVVVHNILVLVLTLAATSKYAKRSYIKNTPIQLALLYTFL